MEGRNSNDACHSTASSPVISVRARIIVLAAIPVVGFMANGIAYTAGEREVEQAFRTADRAADLAEVSREFRGMLIQMRVRTRDFALRSSEELIQAFDDRL